MAYIKYNGQEIILGFNDNCHFYNLLRAVGRQEEYKSADSNIPFLGPRLQNIKFSVSSKGEYKLFSKREKEYIQNNGWGTFRTDAKNVNSEYEFRDIKHRTKINDKYYYMSQPIEIEF